MAEEKDRWIKVRGELWRSPKIMQLVRELWNTDGFQGWLSGSDNDEPVISQPALRGVTLALCVVTWSSVRRHGIYEGDDLFLRDLCVTDLDQFCDVHGIGKALEAVGWAIEREDPYGVILPNYKKYNIPLSDAERQQLRRDRAKKSRDRHDSVQSPSRQPSRKPSRPASQSVTKNRGDSDSDDDEENNNNIPSLQDARAPDREAPPKERAGEDAVADAAAVAKRLNEYFGAALPPDRAADAVARKGHTLADAEAWWRYAQGNSSAKAVALLKLHKHPAQIQGGGGAR